MTEAAVIDPVYEYYYENELPPGTVIYEYAEEGGEYQEHELEEYEYIEGDGEYPKFETLNGPIDEYYYQPEYSLPPNENPELYEVRHGDEQPNEEGDISSDYLDGISTNEEAYIDGSFDASHVDEIIEHVAHDFDDMGSSKLVLPKKKSKHCSPKKREITTTTCEYCGLYLKYPSKILAHMRTHTGERPFKCQYCEKTFSQRTPWRCHVKRHTGDTPFMCNLCTRSFPNASTRKAHLTRVHFKNAAPSRGYYEPDVPVTYIDEDNSTSPPLKSRSEHENALPLHPPVLELADYAVIESTEPPVLEPIEPIPDHCDTSLTESVDDEENDDEEDDNDEILRNMPMIDACHICGLHLKYPSRVQQHMRSHIGWKPFTCGVCGLALSSTSTLKVHMRRLHSSERPFVCRWTCGKRFSTRSHRNEHEKIVHSKIKRYQCAIDQCYKLFTRRTYLTKHLYKDHSDLSLIPLAEKGFRVIAVPCTENMSAKVPDSFDRATARVFCDLDGVKYVVNVLGPMQNSTHKNARSMEDRILDSIVLRQFSRNVDIIAHSDMPVVKREEIPASMIESYITVADDQRDKKGSERERQYANLVQL